MTFGVTGREEEDMKNTKTETDRSSRKAVVMRLVVDLTIEPIMGQCANSSDKDEARWFSDEVLDDPQLILHSSLIGDAIGTVKVVSVPDAPEIDFPIDAILHEHYIDKTEGLRSCDKLESWATNDTECSCGADYANEKIRRLWKVLEIYAPKVTTSR